MFKRGHIQEFLFGERGGGGGGRKCSEKGLLNIFVANYFLQRRPCVSQSVNAGRRWRGKYCFGSIGEQIIGRYPKTITFFNIPGN